MEVSSTRHTKRWLVHVVCTVLLLFFASAARTQDLSPKYTVRDGRMLIELSRALRSSLIDSFIIQYELRELQLQDFLRHNKPDSLLKQGWKIDLNNEQVVVISKPLFPGYDMQNSVDRIIYAQKSAFFPGRFPAVNNGIAYGFNRFRNKSPFALRDSVVVFYLRNNQKANRVMLAGSFNNWNPEALPMQKTDSGWIAPVKLGPGKYWYKFIVDGQWITDPDNQVRENDGQGNINSVFFRTNKLFILNGYLKQNRVFLAGSFNDWRPGELSMNRTAEGWELPLYLSEGTHTYKFVADGRWMADEKNPEVLPDGHGAFNSVLRIGSPYVFRLKGFDKAREVMLSGSFNGWKKDELLMKKVPEGWELPYVLGPGNYEYKFLVDGQWMPDPANTMSAAGDGNSFLTIQPNYTFRLRTAPTVKSVYIAGDFNNWKPGQLPMSREGGEWVFPIHLFAGKVRYKFIVDGKWILDPANKQWEQNEYGTGNSVLWMAQ